MTFSEKILNILKAKINSTNAPLAQTIYFNNGKMYKVYPSDQEGWYDAKYLVSDGVTYDLENIHDIQKIPTPNFAEFDPMMDGYGITGSLDYVIRMKAGAFYNRNEKELCSACLWKSTQLMLANKSVGWQKKDFDRLINWHLQLGMYDEAEKAKKYLSRYGQYTENVFDSTAKSIRDSVFDNMKKYNLDLVAYHDYGSGCCSECAKMRGRVYSISGKSKKFPPLPQYAKINGNFHPGCRCSMSPFFEGEEIFYKGKKVNARKISNRQWIDDRDDTEKNLYQKYLETIQKRDKEAKQAEEYSRKKGHDRQEYDSIVKLLPELSPKSFTGYRRMKTQRTKNFMKLVEAAKQVGIIIDLNEKAPDTN